MVKGLIGWVSLEIVGAIQGKMVKGLIGWVSLEIVRAIQGKMGTTTSNYSVELTRTLVQPVTT